MIESYCPLRATKRDKRPPTSSTDHKREGGQYSFAPQPVTMIGPTGYIPFTTKSAPTPTIQRDHLLCCQHRWSGQSTKRKEYANTDKPEQTHCPFSFLPASARLFSTSSSPLPNPWSNPKRPIPPCQPATRSLRNRRTHAKVLSRLETPKRGYSSVPLCVSGRGKEGSSWSYW